jgi:hypothetical protein
MTSTNVTITIRHNVANVKTGAPFTTDGQRRGSAIALLRNAVKRAGGAVRQTFDAADLTDGVPVDGATRGTPVPVTTFAMAMGSCGIRSAARNYGAGTVALSWILAGGRTNTYSDKAAKSEHHKHLILRHVSGPTLADYLADPAAFDGADGPTVEVVAAR